MIQFGSVSLDEIRWMIPLPFVLAGTVGLVAAIIAGRRQTQRQTHHEATRMQGWVPPAAAPTADSTTDPTTGPTETEESR